ncbi:MAG: glycosyltransferase family 9 protein [Bacteroidetes bacterium]|nr:glycosyltransferase family 9 protein [Fibrella sp.]
MITTSSPARFLIIQTAFIGDVILATALFEQLHAHFPAARLDCLVRKGNESLLANHPFLNEVLVWNKKGTGALFGKYSSLLDLLKIIRPRRYDVVINLQRFGTTGLLTALSDARVTAGFAKNPFARFFTHAAPHELEPGVHEVNRNAGVIEFMTGTLPTGRPKLYPSSSDYEAIAPYKTQPYVCLAPASVWFTKQYPAEKWVDLVREMPPEQRIYLLGAPTDVDLCIRIEREAGRTNVVNLAGKLSLLQSAALMRDAVMNYVNDSAPLHLCSAMNAPTTAVFCSTIPEFGFGPLADSSRVVQAGPLPCRPCTLHGRKACPLGHFDCSYGIDTARLLA